MADPLLRPLTGVVLAQWAGALGTSRRKLLTRGAATLVLALGVSSVAAFRLDFQAKDVGGAVPLLAVLACLHATIWMGFGVFLEWSTCKATQDLRLIGVLPVKSTVVRAAVSTPINLVAVAMSAVLAPVVIKCTADLAGYGYAHASVVFAISVVSSVLAGRLLVQGLRKVLGARVQFQMVLSIALTTWVVAALASLRIVSFFIEHRGWGHDPLFLTAWLGWPIHASAAIDPGSTTWVVATALIGGEYALFWRMNRRFALGPADVVRLHREVPFATVGIPVVRLVTTRAVRNPRTGESICVAALLVVLIGVGGEWLRQNVAGNGDTAAMLRVAGLAPGLVTLFLRALSRRRIPQEAVLGLAVEAHVAGLFGATAVVIGMFGLPAAILNGVSNGMREFVVTAILAICAGVLGLVVGATLCPTLGVGGAEMFVSLAFFAVSSLVLGYLQAMGFAVTLALTVTSIPLTWFLLVALEKRRRTLC